MKKFVSVALSAVLLATPTANIAIAEEPPNGTYVFDTTFRIPAPNQKIVFKTGGLFGKEKYVDVTKDYFNFYNVVKNHPILSIPRNFSDIVTDNWDYDQYFSRDFKPGKPISTLINEFITAGIPSSYLLQDDFLNLLVSDIKHQNPKLELKEIRTKMVAGSSDSTVNAIEKLCAQISAFMNESAPTIGKFGAAFVLTTVLGKGTRVFESLHNYCSKTLSYLKRKLAVSRNKLENNPERVAELLEKNLKEKIFGQNEAIEKIVTKITGYLEERQRNLKTNQHQKSCCILCLYGDSGVGKSESANIITKALCNESSPININPQMLKVDKSEEGKSCIEQLFGDTISVDTRGRKTKTPTKLATQLMDNNKTVLIIEEFDKMRKFDPDGSIDEFLRQAYDRGYVIVGDRKLDLSDTIIILTTNESKESLEKGLSLGREGKKVDISDDTGARTVIDRDQSLLFRLTTVEFKPLSEEAFIKIAKPKLEKIQEYYKKYYNINVIISNDVLNKIANIAVTKRKGARAVNEYIEQISASMAGYRRKCSELHVNYKNKDVYIDFDKNTDAIFLK